MSEKIFQEITEHMDKAIKALKEEYAVVRTGRASPALLESLKVDYYGTVTPLKQMANISAPEPRLLVVQPWDQSALSTIEKAILASETGLNPQSDGKLLRVPIPALTEERRKEMVKQVNKMAEEARVSVRNARRHGMELLKEAEKSKEMSQDDSKKGQTRVQELTDSYVKKVDEIAATKSKELLEV